MTISESRRDLVGHSASAVIAISQAGSGPAGVCRLPLARFESYLASR